MSYSKPVIISDACGFPEVEMNEAGIIIRPTVKSLSSALEKIIQDERLRKKMGTNGFKLVKSQYNWDIIAEKMINEYLKIIRKHNIENIRN